MDKNNTGNDYDSFDDSIDSPVRSTDLKEGQADYHSFDESIDENPMNPMTTESRKRPRRPLSSLDNSLDEEAILAELCPKRVHYDVAQSPISSQRRRPGKLVLPTELERQTCETSTSCSIQFPDVCQSSFYDLKVVSVANADGEGTNKVCHRFLFNSSSWYMVCRPTALT